MKRLNRVGWIGLLTVLCALSACKNEPVPSDGIPTETKPEPPGKEAPSPAVSAAKETKKVAEKSSVETAEETRLSKLEKSYIELFCANRSAASERDLQIFSKRGFKDAADWSSQWHAAALENPEWAAKTVESALAAGCTPSADSVKERGAEEPSENGAEATRD